MGEAVEEAWQRLLKRHSRGIQGVYLRLHPLRELGGDTPYRCHLLLAAPSEVGRLVDWPRTRDTIEKAFTGFWEGLRPDIECGVRNPGSPCPPVPS